MISATAMVPAPIQRGYWIYGAGGFGRRIARELLRLDVPVLGFIDRKGRETSRVDGLPCLHPSEMDDSAISGSHYIHGVMNYHASSSEILEWAADHPFADLVFPAQLFNIEGFELENYWLARPKVTLDNLDKIEEFYDALFDEKSKTLLKSILLYRVTSDPRRHAGTASYDLYAPPFLPIYDRRITLVDGGAYTGDTLEALLAKGVSIVDWIAFEPDAINADALRRTAERHRDRIESFTLLQAGLSDRSGTVRFAAEGAQSSRVLSEGEADDGAVEITVLRFDDVFRRSGDVYVKMDIEGAEQEALRGMPELLRQRPIMAISVYHRPTDLWEIPKLVSQLYERPRMQLALHCHHGFDTVLYVSPG